MSKFTFKDLEEIISNYNLGDLVSFREFSEGNAQQNIFIKTNKHPLVLKFYKNRTIKYVEFETELIKYLNKKNYCCPKIYQNIKGKLFTIRNGKALVFYEYIDTDHRKKLNKNEFRELIKKVAELHLLTQNLKIKGIENRWNYNIDFCKKYISEKSDLYRKERQIKKKNWIEKQLIDLVLPNSLPKGIVHGDLHYTNVCFSKNRIKALIDFDDANYSYLLYDIICLIDAKRKEESFINRDYFNISKATIEEYIKIRPVTEEEKWHLFDVLKLSIIIDSFWFFNRGKYPNFKEKRKIDLLEKMGRNNFYKKVFK